jgi:hypothetical protein
LSAARSNTAATLEDVVEHYKQFFKRVAIQAPAAPSSLRSRASFHPCRIIDPTGATIGLWQPKQAQGAQKK